MNKHLIYTIIDHDLLNRINDYLINPTFTPNCALTITNDNLQHEWMEALSSIVYCHQRTVDELELSEDAKNG